ncbi:MAG: hypothetical protein ACR2QJ_13555 [Geminicoccaceae bacterium]
MARNSHDRRMLGRSRQFGVAAGMTLAVALSACQTGPSSKDGAGQAEAGYPSLHTVPDQPRPSLSVGERRQIVRGLIEERDGSRQKTAVVRRRSGLETGPVPASSAEGAAVDEIIPDALEGDSTFRLRTYEDDQDKAYRDEPEIEDGGLNDFIRQLEEETNPSLPEDATTPDDQPGEDEVGFLPSQGWRVIGPRPAQEGTIWRAAFVPAIGAGADVPQDMMIRLAAAEAEEEGFFCKHVGFLFAWAGACLGESQKQQEGDQSGETKQKDGDQSANVDQGRGSSAKDKDAGSGANSEAQPPGDGKGTSGERKLSDEDAAKAIEDGARDALEPLSASLEKLQRFIRARLSGKKDTADDGGSTTSKRDPYTSPDDAAEAVEPQPVPEDRPRRRDDITVVDKDETFTFTRTPTPTFKPSRDDDGVDEDETDTSGSQAPAKEDQPSNGEGSQGDPPAPEPEKDQDVPEPTDGHTVSKGEQGQQGKDGEKDGNAEGTEKDEGAENEQATPSKAPSGSETPAETAPASPDDQDDTPKERDVDPGDSEQTQAMALAAAKPGPVQTAEMTGPEPDPADSPDPVLITFGSEKQALPDGTELLLVAVLADARARDHEIFIVGEAGTDRLAKRRAKDIGAALIDLGASTKILEYDHEARNGVDQVRLILKPVPPDPRLEAADQAMAE